MSLSLCRNRYCAVALRSTCMVMRVLVASANDGQGSTPTQNRSVMKVTAFDRRPLRPRRGCPGFQGVGGDPFFDRGGWSGAGSRSSAASHRVVIAVHAPSKEPRTSTAASRASPCHGCLTGTTFGVESGFLVNEADILGERFPPALVDLLGLPRQRRPDRDPLRRYRRSATLRRSRDPAPHRPASESWRAAIDGARLTLPDIDILRPPLASSSTKHSPNASPLPLSRSAWPTFPPRHRRRAGLRCHRRTQRPHHRRPRVRRPQTARRGQGPPGGRPGHQATHPRHPAVGAEQGDQAAPHRGQRRIVG